MNVVYYDAMKEVTGEAQDESAIPTKICELCKKQLAITNFYNGNKVCKECKNIRRRKNSTYRLFDITPEELSTLYTFQNGLCYACLYTMTFDEARLDHCHNTDLIRGLAHDFCNHRILTVKAFRIFSRFGFDLDQLNNESPAQQLWPGRKKLKRRIKARGKLPQNHRFCINYIYADAHWRLIYNSIDRTTIYIASSKDKSLLEKYMNHCIEKILAAGNIDSDFIRSLKMCLRKNGEIVPWLEQNI